MSDRDTDDTDILLNSDPMGGLFRDLSLKELVDKHSSILPLTTRKATPSPNEIPKSNGGEIMTNHDLSGTSNMDLSDYFNSQGEIALSGVSEWSLDDSEIDKEKADGDDDDGGESDSSFTYNEENIQKTYDKETNNDNNKAKRMGEIVPAKTTTDETDTSANKTSYVPQFLNHGTVVDINLENPAIDWNIPLPGHLQLQLGPGGSSYLNEKGEQIFTRAPNFRSMNGYQPTTDKEPSRHLTKEQIAEEVKNMYASPEDPELQSDTNPTINTRKVLRFADEIEHVAENPVESALRGGGFNFLNNNDTPVKFDSSPKNSFSVPEGEKLLGRKKQIASKGKRKSINKFHGAGDAASVSTTAATYSSESSPSVTTAKPPSSSSSSTTSSSVPYCTKVIRGMKRTKPKQPAQPGFSFGYGDSENDLSPIRRVGDFIRPVASSSSSQPRVNNCASHHHHHHPSPLGRDDFHDGMGRVKGSAAAMDELKAIWREIQTNRILLRQGDDSSDEGDDDGSSKASFIEDLGKGDGPPSTKSDADKSSSSRGNNFNHVHRPHHPSQPPFTAPFPSPSIDNFESDLEALLNEADINPADFEDIVDDLDIAECDVGAGIDDLLREIVDPNASPQNKETAKLSHWAQSGAVEYVEKYHEEKFRRQECEDEIDRLQKENLNIRQRNAVLEGVTKRKDATILKISKAWKEVATEWRTYEAQTRGDFDKLKKEHVELSGICAQNNEKVQQYEKELIKSVELADNFKTKLTEVQKSKDVAVGKLEVELTSLREKIQIMSKGEMEILEEKKTAVRALTESQQKLDQLQVSYQKLETELHTQKTTALQRDQRLSEISNQKSKLESLLDEKVAQNNELLKKAKQLSDTVEFATLEKMPIRPDANENNLRSRDEGVEER